MFSKEKLSTTLTIVFICVIFFIPIFISAQTYKTLSDTIYFRARVLRDGSIHRRPNWSSVDQTMPIKAGQIVYAYGVNKCDDKYGMFQKDTFIAVSMFPDSGYIEQKNLVFIDGDEFRSYLKDNPSGRQVRKMYAQKKDIEDLDRKAKFIADYYMQLDKIGLVITDKSYTFSEYGHTLGMKFSFYNGFKKSIKYINLTVQPYNRVGDVMADAMGKSKAVAKVIGPLNYGDESSVEFDNLFWNEERIIDCLRIKKIDVIFMDGKSLSIIDINKHLAGSISNCSKIKRSYY